MGIEESQREKSLLDPQTEFETKYRTDIAHLVLFKQLAEKLPNLKKFIYVQGPDVYYSKANSSVAFARYRRAENMPEGGTLTFKERTTKKDNVIRNEDNLDLAKHVTKEQVKAAVNRLGYTYDFEIWKFCHIYKFQDATLVFYAVTNESKETAYFTEIEVEESTIGNYTEDEAWETIKKYEAILEVIPGITFRHRLKQSLYDMYRSR